MSTEALAELEKYTGAEYDYDEETKLYTVWDEYQLSVVCITSYAVVALAAIKAYAEEYIDD